MFLAKSTVEIISEVLNKGINSKQNSSKKRFFTVSVKKPKRRHYTHFKAPLTCAMVSSVRCLGVQHVPSITGSLRSIYCYKTFFKCAYIP